MTAHPAEVVEALELVDTTDAIVIPAPILITPTAYPANPQGTIIVQNHITINIQSDNFKQFNGIMGGLLDELRRSNEISGEVRDQLLSEMRAGREILNGPKPQRGLIDSLLVKPLKYLIENAGSTIIGKLAGAALDWLLKVMM